MSPNANIRKLENVRIGPISIITLIAVLCMAVLGILALSTAHATMTISHRQADASVYLYRNEAAAQQFVAEIDDVLSRTSASGADASSLQLAVNRSLDAICDKVRDVANDEVTVVATMEDDEVIAEFTCANTRKLNIAITIRDDATYRIMKWEMAAVQNGVQTTGHLWSGV